MLVELSYPINETMPQYPNTPKERFVPRSRMARGDRSNSTTIEHFLHTGTHVDAPFHRTESGSTVDRVPIGDFCYENPRVVVAKKGVGGEIGLPDVEYSLAELETADLLLFYTGYSSIRGQKGTAYAEGFPGLSVELAEFIRLSLLRVRGVAIDTLSIENPVQGRKTDFLVHRTLLSEVMFGVRPVLIFEDVNVEPVVGKRIKRVYAFPIRFQGLEASPVAMVAEL